MLSQLAALSGVLRFASVTYLGFLAVAVLVYFVLPGVRTRVAWLLVASAAFYLLLSPATLVVLLATAAVTYLAGLALGALPSPVEGSSQPLVRRTVLVVGLILLAGGLIAYKYLTYTGKVLLHFFGPNELSASLGSLKLLLPLGISFWTFQAIAYVVDVYRGSARPVRNPFLFAVSMAYFPIITSGPITRVQALTEQLSRKHSFDYAKMQSALLLIGLGFFKKLMIADRLAVFVNHVFDNPRAYTSETNGLVLFVAAVFFAIQLYCDFSGYTDIVRGSSRLFGVELPLNFSAPYFSRSVREFWRRWHMSLMDWLRTYLYFPLGGSRKGRVRKYANTLVVFGVSGLWHGTGLTYLIWGLLNAVYTIAGELLAPLNVAVTDFLRIDRESAAHRLFQTLLTFLLVTIAWVFFRANTTADALYILRTMFSPTMWVFTDQTMVRQGLTYSELLVALASVGVLGVLEWAGQRRDLLAGLNRQHLLFRWLAYYALIAVVVLFGHYGGGYNSADFVYFKF